MNKQYIIVIVILVLIAVSVGIYFIVKNNQKTSTNEGFGLPSRAIRVDRVAAASREAAAKGQFYSVPGTYQSMISPRFSNVGYNAYIRYNRPEQKNMGVPSDPISYGKLVDEVENYTPSCNQVEMSEATQNYHDTMNAVEGDSEPTNMLPVADMSSVSMDEDTQPIVYDRFYYANRNTRLRSQGDQIRGDLPIVPCETGWFRPSVTPSIDLQAGAMNVLAGPGNEHAKALSKLIYETSGKTDTTIAGVDLSTEYNTTLSAGSNDITVTAFP